MNFFEPRIRTFLQCNSVSYRQPDRGFAEIRVRVLNQEKKSLTPVNPPSATNDQNEAQVLPPEYLPVPSNSIPWFVSKHNKKDHSEQCQSDIFQNPSLINIALIFRGSGPSGGFDMFAHMAHRAPINYNTFPLLSFPFFSPVTRTQSFSFGFRHGGLLPYVQRTRLFTTGIRSNLGITHI